MMRASPYTRDRWAMAALFAIVFILRILQLDTYPIPTPLIQDEQANLFAAETFASGRIANPIHPLQQFFSITHILDTPTVMSKYPPGASAFMAVSAIISGEPYWGVVLATALAVAACYWALIGWIYSRKIAFAIALILALLLKAPNYWINSYWGGSAALLASFLIIGAYPRLCFRGKLAALWPGLLGAMLGFVTRPYEIGVLCLWLLLMSLPKIIKLPGFGKALQLPLLASICFMGFNLYYNNSITHDPLRLPHTYYTQLYGVAPVFLFNDYRKDDLSNDPIIRSGQRFEIEAYENAEPVWWRLIAQIPGTFCYIWCVDGINGNTLYLTVMAVQFLTNILLIPIILYGLTFTTAKIIGRKELAGGIILLMLASSIATGIQPHYMAALFALLIISLAQLVQCLTGKRHIVTLILIICLLLPSIIMRNTHYTMDEKYFTNRKVIEQKLLEMPEQSLVFVNHIVEAEERPVGEMWIYNHANMDSAKIIWARYLSPDENRKLIDYYPDRKLWYIEPFKERKLLPYKGRKP